jgi:transcriptional regulator with XRE-family HTH domain
MSDPNTLGSVVRRRRLESGYSLGQLASKVGKTAAEVRAWERDAELPEHGILGRLAETLELDLDDIRTRLEAAKAAQEKEAAAEEEKAATPAEPDEPAAAASDATPAVAVIADEEVATLAGEAVTPEEESVKPEEEEESATSAEHAAAEEPAAEVDEEPGFAVADPFTPPEPLEPGEGDELASPAPGRSSDQDLLDAPTEPVPVPVITETAAAARGRAVAVLEEPPPLPRVEPAPDSDPGLLRYLEPLRILFDPNNRYLYWTRAGLTVVVMLIFAVVLLDQFGKLLDAIGELLDTIEPAATNPDELDALGGFFLT